MAVTDWVFHQLSKTSLEQGAELRLREQASDPDYALSMLSEFKRIQASRSGRQLGGLNADAMAVRASLQQWRQGEIPFLRLTQLLSQQLVLKLDQGEETFIGYLCYLLETLESGERLYLLHLRTSAGLNLNQSLDLQATDYLDLGDTGFLICLDLQRFEQGDLPYLTLSFGRSERGLKNLIQEWIGFAETLDKRAETERFLTWVDDYCETLPVEEGEKLREEVVGFCVERERSGEAVAYPEMAEEVDPGIVQFIQQQDSQSQNHLHPDRKALRQYLRLTGRSQDLSLSFASSSLGKGIEFDPTQEVLIIRELPKGLLQQLKKLQV